MEKLELYGYRTVKCLVMFGRFYTIQMCDRQTAGQTGILPRHGTHLCRASRG